MAYVVGDSCIGCFTCMGVCPVEAIREEDGKAKIDEDICLSCGSCAGSCPIGAIDEG